ncbi:hypothetical protein GQX73_g10269 [Xylaria multiplex]|uniref:Uncharacterized protein n=1 Tax=Xylaria multiplex TaxID=323545 RepID=A0A7C8IKG4_9PEZI|nr:hypothetical protein GQX73_g10269 [Xylaria multiplex]
MDLGQGTQVPVVYILPQPTGILPPLRTLNIPHSTGPDRLSAEPLWLLSHTTQSSDHSLRHLGGEPQGSLIWEYEDPPAHNSDASSSADLEHDFTQCLSDHIMEVLDWYRSGVVAAEDVKSLVRRVDQFIYAACRYYAEQGTVPAIRDVQMRPSTTQAPGYMPTGGEETERPASAPSQSFGPESASSSLTFVEEDNISTQELDGANSSMEEISNTISSQDSSFSCPCEGLPSRHILWTQQAGSRQPGNCLF